ncbi:neprilysin-1-like [Dermacentor albipictus]|uniref:neprilysin-1-like n=1 Tax=Dermacentor albipictus TaxID=60249 RepID=UPI0038FC5393
MDGTTENPYSYLRPRPLKMPRRALDHILFPNCPRFPELDNIKLPETDASQREATGASEKTFTAAPVVAAPAPKEPAAKAPAVRAVRWSSDPLPARSSTMFTEKDRKMEASLPVTKENSPVTAKESPEADKKTPPVKEKESPEASQKTEDSSEEREDTENPEDLESSLTWKGSVAEQKNAPMIVFAFVAVLIVAFLVITSVLLARPPVDHYRDADSTGSMRPSGDAGRKKGRSDGEEAGEDVAADLVTALPETVATRKRSFSLAGYGDANGLDGDATSVDCDTESCRWESRLVNDMLNVTADPCEDFYAYVCSASWERSSDDLPYRAAGRAFLINEVTRYFQEHAHSVPPAATRDVIHGEHNFLDHSSIVLSGCLENTVPKGVDRWDGIRGLLRDVGLEEWPYVEPQQQYFQLERVLKLIDRQMAVFPIVYVFLQKLSDGGPYVLHLDAPRDFVCVQYKMQKTDKSLPYKEVIRQTLTLWKTLPRSGALADDVIHFEAQLLEASKPVAKPLWRKDAVYPIKTFPQLPNFHVDAYLSHLRRRHSDEVVVLNEAYVSNLSAILRNPTPRTILNFLGFRVVGQVAPLLPQESIPLGLVRMGYPSFQHHVNPRTQSCFHLVNRLFPHAIRWILRDILAKTPDLDRQWAVTTKNMVSSLAHTFREGAVWTQSVDVADSITRLKALQVAYLAGRESEERLDEYYASANLTYGPKNLVRYYGELLAISLYRYWSSSTGDGNYDARHSPRSSDLEVAWTRAPESTLGVYLTSSGVASAALVTRGGYPSTLFPLLAADVTRALFSCSLDEPQWSSWTRDRFGELRYCLLKRYKRGVRKVRLSSSNVRYFLAEILADNAAVKPLMTAFRRFSHGTTHYGPGGRRFSNRTLWRLFFANYAAGFCVPRSEAAQVDKRMRYRLSLPPKVRVNLALMDVEEFREAFKCGREYAAPQCPVWKRKSDDDIGNAVEA